MNKRIWIGDFETTTVNTKYYKNTGDSIVYLWYLENLNNNNNYLGNSLNDFIDTIINNSSQFDLIYFHNLSFDGYFIMKYLINEFNTKYITNFITPYDIGICCLRSGNKIYQIVWRFKVKSKIKEIRFNCSLRLLTSSVEMLGKDLGLNKFTGNEAQNFYDNEPNAPLSNEFIDYIKSDVKIVKAALIEFDTAIQSIHIGDYELTWYNNLTIGAISFKIQQYYFNKELPNKNIFIDAKTYKIASSFYYGGWTQFNPEIQYNEVVGNGVSYDINSMYPWAMTQLLPYGDITDNIKILDINQPILEYWEIDIKCATAKTQQIINLLNWKKRNKSDDLILNHRYSPFLTNFKCFYLREEFETLQKFYDFEGIKIIKKYYAQAAYWASEFVDELYNLRLDFKNKKLPALANSIKILLNAGYGKHASREIFLDEIVVTKSCYYAWEKTRCENITLGEKTYKILGINKFFECKNYIVLVGEDLDPTPKFYNKLAAATICAYGRIKLWNAICILDPVDFLYADTDSIYFLENKEYYKELYIDNVKIGAFKKEDEFNKFIVSGAKVYACFDNLGNNVKAKFSGIKQKWLKENISLDIYKNQDQVFQDANLKPRYLKSGIILEKADYKPTKRGI